MDRKICMALMLILWSADDVKKKKIKLWFMPILLMRQLVFLTGQESDVWIHSLWGIAVGILCCMISIRFRGVIGMGDGCVIGLLGWYMGFTGLLMLLGIALSLAGMTAAIYVVFKKGKTARLPFIPYICVGYMMMWDCFR